MSGTAQKVKPKKHRKLIQYSDALAGRKKIEKLNPKKVGKGYVNETVLEFTEKMLVGMIEHGVVLDGFSSGIIKEIILAWDSAGMITSKHGKSIVVKIKANKTTKRSVKI